jgi:hypothetical protein
LPSSALPLPADGSFDTCPAPQVIRQLVEAIFAPADHEAVLASSNATGGRATNNPVAGVAGHPQGERR